MKILVATPFMSQHFDAGLFWVKALCNLGHSVNLWDYRVDPESVFPTISNVKYDLDLTIVFKGESIDPRRLHSPKVCYWPDALERTPGIEDKLRLYDKVFTPVRPTPDWMEWLPSGWDPSIHKDLRISRPVDTMYIGTANSPYKVDMVTNILPNIIRGNNWIGPYKGIGRPAYLHEYVNTLNLARVLIDVHQSPVVGVNRKLFEMIACGPTIVDRVPGVMEILGGIFGLSVTYTSVNEAKELISYFLKYPEERERIWKVEREMILPYTYENCARRLLEWQRSVD